jgi:hypothetical protein
VGDEVRHRQAACAASSAACSDVSYDWLVQVAPLIMSTFALWAAMTAWVRVGTAESLIRLLWSSCGDDTTMTSLILPPLTIAWTWNVPHGSETADPIHVPSA